MLNMITWFFEKLKKKKFNKTPKLWTLNVKFPKSIRLPIKFISMFNSGSWLTLEGTYLGDSDETKSIEFPPTGSLSPQLIQYYSAVVGVVLGNSEQMLQVNLKKTIFPIFKPLKFDCKKKRIFVCPSLFFRFRSSRYKTTQYTGIRTNDPLNVQRVCYRLRRHPLSKLLSLA